MSVLFGYLNLTSAYISGGTLKIYGESVNPGVPYKTLLLSISDTAAYVVKETLEKYGLDREDPNNYMLVQVNIGESLIIILIHKRVEMHTLL